MYMYVCIPTIERTIAKLNLQSLCHWKTTRWCTKILGWGIQHLKLLNSSEKKEVRGGGACLQPQHPIFSDAHPHIS